MVGAVVASPAHGYRPMFSSTRRVNSSVDAVPPRSRVRTGVVARTSIYSDLLLVLSAPLARRLGPPLGPRGIALMGGALTAGIEVGLVFVAPGVAAIAIAGVLGVPLGDMFLFGLLVGVPTAAIAMLLFQLALPRLVRWNPALDEVPLSVETDPERDPE